MMHDLINDGGDSSEVSKLAYVKPELIEAGKIADITLSNGNDAGGDAGYS